MSAADDTKGPMPLALVPSAAAVAADAADAIVLDEDDDLVARARRGDQAAFAALFHKHHGRVHAMCVRLLGRGRGDGDIDDAVQQTFLEAWRCLHRFEGKSRFTTWLTRIAIHTCFSVRRRLRRLLLAYDEAQGLALVDAEPAARASAHGASAHGASAHGASAHTASADRVVAEGPLPPDEYAIRAAQTRALDDVLQQLSPKKRVVFVLADLEDRTSPEIAAILEIPEATVRTRLFHARKELAALLRTHPGFAAAFARAGVVVDDVPPRGGAR
jgi:RNA polymerase sigma-70 factor (ECF subfamily)